MPSAERDGTRSPLPALPLTPLSEVEAKVMIPGSYILDVDVAELVGVGWVEIGGIGAKSHPGAVSRQARWPSARRCI